MKKLLSIILSLAILFSMSLSTFAFGTHGVMQKAKIKVGINAQFPPFEYYDENGELTGFDIDLMSYIGEEIGFDIEFVDMSFDKLFPAVINGDVACCISAISITKERDNIIDYSTPYLSAKVTYSDGETPDTSIEQYAIVFPNNSRTETSIYNHINDALCDLIEDKTVEKLGEKYNLNKVYNTDAYDYEYTIMTVSDDFDSEVLSDGTPLAPPSDWALSDIKKAQALNITEEGKIYRYRMSITREEFCDLIYNYCKEVAGVLWTYDGNTSFKDTDSKKVNILNAAGIIKGKSETEFAPNDLLTREEAATILNRLINVAHPDSASTELYFEFADSALISDWAMNSIQRICNMGIMKGVENNRFSPKENYTTEQAIVTLVRIYAAFSNGKNYIGGADTPTEIYICEDVEVSDFYINEAFKHAKKAGELAGTKEFISLYTDDDDVKATVENLSKTDFEKPMQMYYVSYNIDKVIEYYNEMLAKENIEEEIDIKRYFELNGFNLSYLANRINARYGSKTLVATSVLTSREGYIMPKDFKKDFGIYLQYTGEYSALVTFSKIGDGVIEARMQFVRNGEKEDILMFMSEVYDALGKESITVRKIKQ